MDQLEDLLMEHGIMKKVDESWSARPLPNSSPDASRVEGRESGQFRAPVPPGTWLTRACSDSPLSTLDPPDRSNDMSLTVESARPQQGT
jgi:hypothetical protein